MKKRVSSSVSQAQLEKAYKNHLHQELLKLEAEKNQTEEYIPSPIHPLQLSLFCLNAHQELSLRAKRGWQTRRRNQVRAQSSSLSIEHNK